MESVRILSTQLKQLNPTVKNLINQGIWFLYTMKNDDGAEYALVANEDIYFLDGKGKVLARKKKIDCDDSLGQSVYFSDIPLPNSLGNMVKTVYA